MSGPGRVLVAERSRSTRMGLRLALQDAGLTVVAEAQDRNGAVAAAVEFRPDVALVSTDLAGGGIETARMIAEQVSGTRVVVLSPAPDGEELLAAVLAGASGYLSKEISPERLPRALEGVIRGEVALPRRYTQHLLDQLRGREIERTRVSALASAPLTDREWEILRLLGEDASTVQMAQRLEISEVTVRRHISAVLRRLGGKNPADPAEVLRRSAD
jgi:DNA-binding NarL/FixJ family response regulator